MAITMATCPTPLLYTKTTNSNYHCHHQPIIHNNLTRIIHLLSKSNTISHSHLKQIHAPLLRTINTNHPQSLFLYTKLLHHASLTNLNYATRILHHFHKPNSFMWNILIRAYARSINDKHIAVLLYKEMMMEEESEVLFDKYTYPFVLKACAYLFLLCEGKQVHAHVLKLGFELDTHVCNSLIHFYASCGCLEFARKVFEKMCERRSEVSWNIMIDSYARVGEFETALKLFGEMQKVYEPDCYTMQSVIIACAGLGALSLGMWAHAYVLRKCKKNVAGDVLVNTCLVDMYCKCGSLEIAQQVFERMPCRDVNSWNSIILGFAMHGKAEVALQYYTRMVKMEKLVPNSITFVGVLSACNHSGIDESASRNVL